MEVRSAIVCSAAAMQFPVGALTIRVRGIDHHRLFKSVLAHVCEAHDTTRQTILDDVSSCIEQSTNSSASWQVLETPFLNTLITNNQDNNEQLLHTRPHRDVPPA